MSDVHADKTVTVYGTKVSYYTADGPPPSLEGCWLPSFGVSYTPKCLEWPFEFPIRSGSNWTPRMSRGFAPLGMRRTKPLAADSAPAFDGSDRGRSRVRFRLGC